MRYPFYPLPKKQGGMAPVHVRDLANMLASATSAPIGGEAAMLDVRGGENYALRRCFKIVSETYVKKHPHPALGASSASPSAARRARHAAAMPRSPKLAHFLAIGGSGSGGRRAPTRGRRIR